jgi:hypothetical protein
MRTTVAQGVVSSGMIPARPAPQDQQNDAHSGLAVRHVAQTRTPVVYSRKFPVLSSFYMKIRQADGRGKRENFPNRADVNQRIQVDRVGGGIYESLF